MLASPQVRPTTANIERLGRLLADRLCVPIHANSELSEAPEALAALGSNHTQGKLPIRIR
jgi:hypothetical protein